MRLVPSSSNSSLLVILWTAVLLWSGGEKDGRMMAMAFHVPGHTTVHTTTLRRRRSTSIPKQQPFYLSQEDNEMMNTGTSPEEESSETTTTTSVVTPQPSSDDDNTAKYPINLPSPILLTSSMIIAIASTGSLFELFQEGTSPPLGFIPTAAIVTLGFPVTLFLFYAAIQKAIAETEEDDQRFLSGR